MSKRSKRRVRRASDKEKSSRDSGKEEKPEEKQLASEPWLSERTGYRAIVVLSLGLAIFMAWQLWPSEGPLGAILWGIGFGAALWVVFLLSLAFNRWIRGSRRK